MTTALDVEFEQIMSSGDAPEPRHALCSLCYRSGALPAEVTTPCGKRMPSSAWLAGRGSGKHKCAKCLALDLAWGTAPLPCGH